ncbi:MAG: GntR family transcriptional regulator [Anaerolineales bacterium]|nr:GntR family transcriptional regulator [Anaerolineales bacterium]
MALQIDLDPNSVIPLYIQLGTRLEYMIGTGVLPAGAQVPSVRDLATQLGIAPTTVQQAYRELQQKGLLETQRGLGTFVPQITTSIQVDRGRSATLRNLIDDAIEYGTSQRLSLDEIRLVFEDRMALRERGLRIGFVGIKDAMHKYAGLIQSSLGNLKATVSPVPLGELRADPRIATNLHEKFDLLVTLLFHYREVIDMAGSSLPVLSIISELGNQCLESIALLPTDAVIGLVCHRASLSNYLATIKQYRPPDGEILYGDPEVKTPITQQLKDVTVVLHTTVLTYFVQNNFPADFPLIELKHVPNKESLERIRSEVEKSQLGKD